MRSSAIIRTNCRRPEQAIHIRDGKLPARSTQAAIIVAVARKTVYLSRGFRTLQLAILSLRSVMQTALPKHDLNFTASI